MAGAADAEGFPVPKCAWHPDRAPIAACVRCGRVMCRACASMGAEGYVCPECGATCGASDRAAANVGEDRARSAARRRTRQLALLGLVPVIGAPAALAAVLIGGADLRQAANDRRGLLLSCALGLVGLLASAVIVGIYLTR